ncbi:MAG: hypothetical protein ACRDQY_08190, partial [Pseudonocardiaceae bacterium]
MQDRHWLPGLETGGRVALVQKVSIHREIGCPLTGEVICVPYTRLHRAAKGVRDLGIPPAPRAATIHAVTDAIGADLRHVHPPRGIAQRLGHDVLFAAIGSDQDGLRCSRPAWGGDTAVHL